MDEDRRKTLELLSEIAREPIPTGPVELDPDYLRAVAWQESLPQNQSGVDKSWVERSLSDFKRHFAGARRVS